MTTGLQAKALTAAWAAV